MTTRRRPARRALAAVVAALLGLGSALVAVAPASAAPAGWADFEFAGTSQNFAGTMTQQASGFPVAAIVSNSAGGAVGEQTGASIFLSAGTPVEPIYGSSRNSPYLNLRPLQQNAGTSVTTYPFERPTPASGWTFVLGDIDADEVRITATGVDGQPVDPADLGFQSAFNYCAAQVSPRPSCPTNQALTEPTWQPDSGILLGDVPQFRDTAGAAAWFQPTVALTSLTFEYTRRSGFPVYQTWFSALEYDISGTVEFPDELDPEDLTLRLYDPAGNEVGTAQPAADGSYSFPGFATFDGYRVALDRPAGYTSDDPLSQRVDLSDGDRTDVDFTLREIVPVPVSGTVRDPEGEPVAGVTITLRNTDGDTIGTVVTGADGGYLFDTVESGTGRTLTATPPAGTTVSEPLTFAVPPDSEEPIEDQDFVVTPIPTGTASGRVTNEDGAPQAGVLITVTGGGNSFTARTGADGTWSITDLPVGEYTVAISAPDGSEVVGDAELPFDVTTDDLTESGLDFELAVPDVEEYGASGTITDSTGAGIAVVTVVVTIPDTGAQVEVSTDEDGNWFVEELEAGQGYTARIQVPDGYQRDGATELTFDVVDGNVTGLNFVLVADATPPPSPTPSTPTPSATPRPTAEPTASPSFNPIDDDPIDDDPAEDTTSSVTDSLGDTGGPSALVAVGAALLIVAGAVALLIGRHRPG
jgi:hypothetical protein